MKFNNVDFYPFLRPVYQILTPRLLSNKHKLLEVQNLEKRPLYDLHNRAKHDLASVGPLPGRRVCTGLHVAEESHASYGRLTFNENMTSTGI